MTLRYYDRIRKSLVVLFILALAIFAALIVLKFAFHIDVGFGYRCIYIAEHNSTNRWGKTTEDGRFTLIEMRDNGNELIQYTVWDEAVNQIVFTTMDPPHYTAFCSDAEWIEGTYDFVVEDSDSGNQIYEYCGDGFFDSIWQLALPGEYEAAMPEEHLDMGALNDFVYGAIGDISEE